MEAAGYPGAGEEARRFGTRPLKLTAVHVSEVSNPAAMGGHLYCRHDRPPENEVVSFGYARLADASRAEERAGRLGPESAMCKLLRSG
ncbi:MAG: hypothetical protein OXI87_10180 [Albidovulum sp.]|nr:hypothetical protein [Albidovulum sp.]